MTLDELDLLLIRELELDARQGAHALAMKLGEKRTTVNNRLRRLINGRVVTISAVGDRVSLGYNLLFAVGLNVHPGKASAVAEQLTSRDFVKAVALTTGHYNIMAWPVFRTQAEFIEFIDEDLSRIPGIARIDTSLVLRRMKYAWRYFNMPELEPTSSAGGETAGHNLSDLELSMIRELELAPLQNMKELAARVHSSRWIVTKEFQKLVSNGIIRFVSVVDPRALGLKVQVLIRVEVKPGEIYTVVHALSHHRPAVNISLITGNFQIILVAIFEDIPQMYDFISNTLELIPEVIRHEIIPVMKWVKYTMRMLS